jgi:hypothetical protein
MKYICFGYLEPGKFEGMKPRWRRTEKTRAVLPQLPSSEPVAEKAKPEGAREPTGHGRDGAAQFTGARIVTVRHQILHPGNACPECGVGKIYRQKQPKTLVKLLTRKAIFHVTLISLTACGIRHGSVSTPTQSFQKSCDGSPNGASISGYLLPTTPKGVSCIPVTKTCVNGVWTGPSNVYSSCTELP